MPIVFLICKNKLSKALKKQYEEVVEFTEEMSLECINSRNLTLYTENEEIIERLFKNNAIQEQFRKIADYIEMIFLSDRKSFSKNDYAIAFNYEFDKINQPNVFEDITKFSHMVIDFICSSNVGFIYVDLQDKDVIYIVSAGAEEYSARASAEGAIQEKGYISVFPTMVNIDNEPVYFMGLKDNAGLIKAYAFVSYKNYQKVAVGNTVEEALRNYTGKNNYVSSETEEKTIEVSEIASAVVDGFTIYYIKDTNNDCYSCSIEISEKLPFIKQGDIFKALVNNKQIVEIK